MSHNEFKELFSNEQDLKINDFFPLAISIEVVYTVSATPSKYFLPGFTAIYNVAQKILIQQLWKAPSNASEYHFISSSHVHLCRHHPIPFPHIFIAAASMLRTPFTTMIAKFCMISAFQLSQESILACVCLAARNH